MDKGSEFARLEEFVDNLLVKYKEARQQCVVLEAAIEEANERNPEHKLINETYAFEAMNLPVTLGYLLWSIEKSEMRGSCPLELSLSLDKKWDQVELMLEAYSDYIGSAEET